MIEKRQTKKQSIRDLIEVYLPETQTIDDFLNTELIQDETLMELYRRYMEED